MNGHYHQRKQSQAEKMQRQVQERTDDAIEKARKSTPGILQIFDDP